MHSDFRYIVIMLCSILVCSLGVRASQRKLQLTGWQKFALGLGGFIGAMFGAKLPFVLTDPRGPWIDATWLSDGKTILCGLVGGYLGVEVAKVLTDVRIKTGDSYAVPVALAVAIGRVGCFFGGCCFGQPTSLPWGVVFPTAPDKLPRHPTQLYEAAFHVSVAIFLVVCAQQGWLDRQRFKLYILLYLGYRFVTEWLRPEIPLLLGLTAYQWGALFLTPIFITLWIIDARQTKTPASDPQ